MKLWFLIMSFMLSTSALADGHSLFSAKVGLMANNKSLGASAVANVRVPLVEKLALSSAIGLSHWSNRSVIYQDFLLERSMDKFVLGVGLSKFKNKRRYVVRASKGKFEVSGYMPYKNRTSKRAVIGLAYRIPLEF